MQPKIRIAWDNGGTDLYLNLFYESNNVFDVVLYVELRPRHGPDEQREGR